MLLVELEKTKILLEEQTDNIITKMKEELDKRNEGGLEYHVKSLLGEVIITVSQLILSLFFILFCIFLLNSGERSIV